MMALLITLCKARDANTFGQHKACAQRLNESWLVEMV